jgi:hypothetical protein
VVRSGRRLRPVLRAPRTQARTSVYNTRRDASARRLTAAAAANLHLLERRRPEG